MSRGGGYTGGMVFVVYLRDRQIHMLTGIEVWRRDSAHLDTYPAVNRAQQLTLNTAEVRIVEEAEIAQPSRAE
jgi:predicted NUDIX family NTP pyrophosphohydrolase